MIPFIVVSVIATIIAIVTAILILAEVGEEGMGIVGFVLVLINIVLLVWGLNININVFVLVLCIVTAILGFATAISCIQSEESIAKVASIIAAICSFIIPVILISGVL